LRYYILTSTTKAGSGHPSSSLSAVELMTALMFGGFFKFNADNSDDVNNDRLIFSKGHAAPLLYALWTVSGQVSEQELMSLRKINSSLEGHPTPEFKYTEAATGSLGQGLSIGVGMALNAKLDQLSYKTFVLLGDSEMVEGSNWEALELAQYYKLDNLIGILDVNRLGQRGKTIHGHQIKAYQQRISSFGWQTILVDGHSFSQIVKAYQKANRSKKPVMIIAKTIKGKGVDFMENKNGWHGKVLTNKQLSKALDQLGKIDKSVSGTIAKNRKLNVKDKEGRFKIKKGCRLCQLCCKQDCDSATIINYQTPLATRKVYGRALARIFPQYPQIVVLDAETSNSTYAKDFKESYPDRFVECFIAEQNMIGMAVGLAMREKIPFVSSFAAFLSRAYDQIRMAQYSKANIKIVGSHAGVSIGADGASQMGLEDLAFFRTILNSVVLYPADAISCDQLVELAAEHQGLVYLRTTRADTPIIYKSVDEFKIGGSKTVCQSNQDQVTIVSAGITLHQALAAHQKLLKQGIRTRVIDCYSIKPIDRKSLIKAAKQTKNIITVEDHFAQGGLGEAVNTALTLINVDIYNLAVRKMPRSGASEKLLDYEEISTKSIVNKVKKIV